MGPNHAQVGMTYNNVAIMLANQGKDKKALAMYEKALAIKVKALGPDHSEVGVQLETRTTAWQPWLKRKAAWCRHWSTLLELCMRTCALTVLITRKQLTPRTQQTKFVACWRSR